MIGEVSLISAVILAMAIAWFAIPPIIRVARIKKLYDEPIELRKIHKRRIPSLGGIGIFTSFLITCGLFMSPQAPYANYLLASGVIIFTIGLKDDLVGMDPYKKFAAQILAAFIIAYLADIRITSFYGMLGIYDISKELSYAVSILFIVFTTNAFNLIDGIDGLAGSIGIIVCSTFGIVFYQMGDTGFALIAFALIGAILGFMRFNVSPAKIFMGDSGSYTIGFVIATLAILFVELNKYDLTVNPQPFVKSVPAVALGVLIIPIFDTIRVFFMRIVKGTSPFIADRNHLHHRLIDIGLSHTQATLALSGVNIFFVLLAFQLQYIGTLELVIIVLLLAQSINVALWLYDIRVRKIARKTLDLPEITPFRKAEYENAAERKTFVEELLNN
ncbi:UDP-N-acetylmuramyl pentapeptide phosphotransferase/UDP-N-acetylglucosamine-1-phosphate transferase [Anseongella ginsenosidimutans]|uniref:UDP-N-acetylmuramyl pentapeptide phosphotransferase/UDP-N-acetylglucosamine-1-phosphate transferase n=2 Tax=Anseongella ginsenosidimutans TaxID=496056 RepID=A0A4R3KM27_9SPHI|nr:UDP-N-acetylmuramyl pentapeptide phosphotransferase/UDP-N-acetylglucosamine-1-phosphate transferase [Anseongella ginsenosidimutans]